jgi:tetratricopeptide (TPR) repeat protein
MPSESPFLIQKVECPVCKTINEFEQIKVGAYNEDGRDTDFCPRQIVWRYPKYQAYNPLVFFTATCSNCYYTREFTNKYREWKGDNAFRTLQLKTIKAKHLEELSVAESVVRQLGEAIDISRYPNESAIVKLLLAVFDAQLTEHPNNLDLGRFYLRIGWVFRHLGVGEDPNMTIVNGLMSDMEAKLADLESALTNSQQGLDDLAGAVKANYDAEQLPAGLQAQMLAYRDVFDSELAAMNESLQKLIERRGSFESALGEYRSEVIGSGATDGQAVFGKHASLAEFLMKLRSHWSGIVCSEREALEQAIRYYKEAFATGREIAAGNQQIQASYLIAELSRRIGDYDGAKQFFTSTIKTGQEFIYRNRRDQSRTVLARKILELAIEQGRINLKAAEAK